MSTPRTANGRLPPPLREALRQWAEDSGCRLMVLFGSSAKGGGPGAPGDVDLAVHFQDQPDATRRLGMIGELQDLCGSRRVDVVFLHPDTDPVLRFEVFRGGAPVYEAHPGIFTEEVVRALHLYEDALPFRRALRESLRKGSVRT